MSFQPCPVDNCGREAQFGHLLCRDCWFQVPVTLRREVWRTWRRYMRSHSDNDFAAYDQAREAAITSVP
jgi:hypothetical protein